MLTGLRNLKRNVEIDAGAERMKARDKRRTTDPRKLRRTQDCVIVVDARDDVLVLRDNTVVGAVGLAASAMHCSILP
ncbi:MAG: hypothetical protein HC853_08605 [Anaerolineae bacterium]|nr:hypothetical protein [Anaerolineae bacterium]